MKVESSTRYLHRWAIGLLFCWENGEIIQIHIVSIWFSPFYSVSTGFCIAERIFRYFVSNTYFHGMTFPHFLSLLIYQYMNEVYPWTYELSSFFTLMLLSLPLWSQLVKVESSTRFLHRWAIGLLFCWENEEIIQTHIVSVWFFLFYSVGTGFCIAERMFCYSVQSLFYLYDFPLVCENQVTYKVSALVSDWPVVLLGKWRNHSNTYCIGMIFSYH